MEIDIDNGEIGPIMQRLDRHMHRWIYRCIGSSIDSHRDKINKLICMMVDRKRYS